MRIHPPVIIRFVVWQVLIFAFAGGVLAQTTLDRLEQQIRQRVSPSREGTSVYRPARCAADGLRPIAFA